jgi:hypothetical protein
MVVVALRLDTASKNLFAGKTGVGGAEPPPSDSAVALAIGGGLEFSGKHRRAGQAPLLWGWRQLKREGEQY